MTRRMKTWVSVGIVSALVLVGISVGVRLRSPRVLNVLLITLDTTRADHIGCYGYSGALTPHLDQLARDGVMFENAYTTMPLTLPAHASMLTGRYPPENGIHQNGNARLDPKIPTMTSYLREKGYQTGAFIASIVLHSKHGLDQAFDVYDDDMAGGRRHGSESHLMRDGDQVVDSALRWQNGLLGGPFFCWVHLYDPHAPFEGHAEVFRDQFRDRPYDGDIAFADLQVGRLIDDLKTRGVYDDTLIIVVGDHGEGFGEHQEAEHGFMLYNATLRVPMVMKVPQLSRSGYRVPETVSVVDILPSVLDCLSLPVPREIGGRSVAAALRGQSIDSHSCYAESEACNRAFGWAPLSSVIVDSWKYISTTRSELYNLATDPGELENLIEKDVEQAEQMHRLLVDMREQMADSASVMIELSDSDRRDLRSIGYVAGGADSPVTGTTATLPDVKDMILHYNAEVDARKLIAAGKADQAAEMLRKSIEAAPSFIPARLTLGAAFEEMRLPDDAEKVYQEAVQSYPDDADSYFALAKFQASRGNLSAAIQNYSRVVEIDPHYATAHINLASVCFAAGQMEQAAKHFEAGLAEFPDSTVGLFNFGVFLINQNQPQAALIHLNRAAQLNPANPQIQFQLGSVLASTGSFSEAAAHFEAVLRINPDYPDAADQFQLMRQKMAGSPQSAGP